MDYVGYYRVSTKGQSKSGLGLEAQQHLVRQFADQHGKLVAEFVEVESGRSDQRAELAKAIIRTKKTGASLLIARLDRFSRRVSFIASMMEKGISLVIAEMPHATDFQLHIFAALAQEERRLISERTKAALAQAKRRGTILGANGITLAARNRELANEFAKAILPFLPDDWRRASYSSLAKQMNSQGIKTATGRNFHSQTVKNLVLRLRTVDSHINGEAHSP